MNELDPWTSAEAKRRFASQVAIVGVSLLILQVVIATVAGVAAFRNVKRRGLVTADAGSAVLFQGRAWFVETTSRSGVAASKRLASVGVDDDAPARVGPTVPSATRYLATDGESLWVLGRRTFERYDGAQVVKVGAWTGPNAPSKPFVHDGHIAFFDWRGCQLRLYRLDGEPWAVTTVGNWKTTNCELTPATWTVLPTDSGFDVFAQFERDLRWRHVGSEDTLEDPADWERISSDVSFWAASRREGESVVLLTTQTGRFEHGLSAVRRTGDAWTAIPLPVVTFGAVGALPSEGDAVLLVASAFQGVTTLELRGDAVGRKHAHRIAGGLPFAPLWMVLLVLVSVVPAGVGAVLIARLMKRDRADVWPAADGQRRYATIVQRGVAHAVDFVLCWIVVLPWVVGMARTPEAFVMQPRTLLAPVLASCACWACTVLATSCTEGRWGGTPGKWLVGIRVVGADGGSIGFSRALQRNLLRVIDGGMNGAVAILLVAFSPTWQRLGDIVAKTVVVRSRG